MAQKKLSEILRENAQNKEEQLVEVARINKLFDEEYNKSINLPIPNNKTNNFVLPTAKLATEKEKKSKLKTINNSNGLINKVGYVAKKGGTGILSGIAGIAQAGLTDTANNLQKGKNKSGVEVATNLLEAFSGASSPIQTYSKNVKNLPNMIGNVIKTINDKDSSPIEKAISLGTTAVSDGLNNNAVSNMIDSGVQLAGKVLPSNASERTLEINQKISEPIDKINQNLYLEGQNYDKATQFIGNATQSVGNMVPSVAVTALTKNPNLGLMTMGVSVKGQSTQEALNKGATLNEAIKIGDTKGAIEVATEMLTGGVNIFGKGALDDIVEKGIKNKVKNKVGKYLLEKGYQLGGEVLEETVSDVLGTVIDKGTVDPDATYSIEDWGDTAVTTILSTLILNAITGGIGKVNNKVNNYDYNTQQKLQEAQDIIDNVNKENTGLNLQRNQATNQINTNTQQIIPQQNKMPQNQISEQIKIDSNNFSKQVDEVINGTFPQKDMLVLGKTPQVLKDIGLPDLPITMTQKHLDTIMNESGKYKNANYHNLGIDIVKQLPEAINNPLDIVKSNTQDNSIVLTTYLSDKQNRTVVASIKIDGTGKVNDVIIDTNVMTSAYGRNNYEKFMEDNIKNGNLLYDIDRGILKKLPRQGYNYLGLATNEIAGARLQLPRSSNSNINNSITQNKNSVNTVTNNYMQSSEKNTQNNKFNLPMPEKTMKDIVLPNYTEQQTVNNAETVEGNTQGESINWNEIQRPEQGKFRKHYQSIIQSNNTTAEAKTTAKEVMGLDTYEPDSNIKQLDKADNRISLSGADTELSSITSKIMNNEKITPVDIAVGERLIQYYSKTGNKTNLRDAIQITAMMGTEAGQTVQAMSLLNHQTPQGQAVWLQRTVEKMNNELKQKRGEKAEQFNLTSDMLEKIVNSETKEQLNNNLEEVYKELGQQVHKSTIEQIDSWRYFSMLGNFRTHIRNMTGNFLMGIAQDTKNKVAGAIEGSVAKFNPKIERTQTIKMPSKEVLEFAKNDLKNVKLDSGNKYNPKNMLESNMRTFKSDAMENTLGRLFKWNDNLLEAEDGLGLKAGYKKALAQYITANNIDINNISDSQLAKARKYAIQQAQERTFHQVNTIASAINSFTRKNKVTKAIGDSVLPFVKNPVNVAKTGFDYSSAGLAKTIIIDTVILRKGNISINQYIDNLSKGLTGSAITMLGYALAQAGILKASGSDDDKKEKFDEQSGKQAYSIQVGDKTYSIDWLAPVGIPLMLGAEIYEGLTQKKDEKSSKSTDDDEALNKFLNRAEVLTNSLTSTLDPMVEMSMISGLVNSIKSFAQGDTQALSGMVTNAAKSYINQFVPTLFGQIAKTTDTVERDTTSTETGMLPKAINSTFNQVKSKIPGLRQTLPTKKDIWGEEIKLADNWAERFTQAGILPMTIKQINNTQVVKELNNLYDKTGEASILPKIIEKKITINSQDYRFTNEEYNKYKTNYGRNSYRLINKLISASGYNKMTDKEKQTAIEKIYEYAKEQNKLDYSNNNKLNYEESNLSKTTNLIKKANGNVSNYFEYLAKTQDLDKNNDKIKYLANSSIENKTKKLIYENSIGSDDEVYNVMKYTGINITEYLKYKQQDFVSDKKDDGTINGKTVSGSKKDKVVNYINSMDITGEQRLLLYAINGYSVSSTQKTQLANYVNNLSLNKDEKLKVFNKFSGFTVYKDGSVTW